MKNTLLIALSIIFLTLPACFDKAPDDKTIVQETRLTAKSIETSGIWGTHTEAGPMFNDDKSALILAANKIVANRMFSYNTTNLPKKLYFQDLDFQKLNDKVFIVGNAIIQDQFNKSEEELLIGIETKSDENGNIILGQEIHKCKGAPCTSCSIITIDGEIGCKCNVGEKCNHEVETIVETSSD